MQMHTAGILTRAQMRKVGARHRVLVVGCERALARFICTFLRLYGYEVDEAFSDSSALRKAAAHPPDVAIVMVVLMQGLVYGLDIGERISRRSKCSVIFLSATDYYYIRHDLKCIHSEGCISSLLSLPFENSELLATLQYLTTLTKARRRMRFSRIAIQSDEKSAIRRRESGR